MTSEPGGSDRIGADPPIASFAALGGFPHEGDPRRVLFHATPVPTVVVDVGAGDVAVNEAFRRLFGFEPGQVSVGELEQVTHPDDRALTNEYHRSLIEEGVPVELAKRYVRTDGTVFWGHLTAAPLFDADGRRWGVIGAIVDVTDMVEARAALVESEQRFRALVQNATDAIVVLDADGHLEYASPSAERLTGNRTDDNLGVDIFRFVHPDDRAAVARTFALIFDAAPGHTGNPLQFRVVHNDGSIRFVEALGTNLLEEPSVGGVVVNIRDLTDTAEASSALELTENRFRRMIENISDTVTLLDADARIVEGAGSIRPILGFPTDFWGDRSLLDLVHPDDADRVGSRFAELCAVPGSDLHGEMRIGTVDGSWIDAEVYAVNLLDDPDVAAIVLTTRDISERKRAERELNEARDEAIQALQMRTEFIASVSHELRSPIHGVLGLAELLASASLDDDARQLAQSIGRATETLRMVLDDILDYSKIEVGRLDIHPAPVLVSELADDVLVLFGSEARAKGIALVLEAEPGFPREVRVDGLRVRQVLTNLVGNAVKFTVRGEVRVRAEVEPPTDGGPTRVRIEVRDTGIGIPGDAYDRLFQPFSQAHTSTAGQFGGTGLGLSIAKQLVELMGGELGFESVPGQGSTFWFVLPVEVLDQARSGSAPSPEPSIGGTTGRERPGIRVMVVEDNAINQMLVRRQLQRLGFEGVIFETGVAAVERYAETDPSVILMDWQLPGMDGLETTRRLRAVERDLGRSRTPIIAVTASAQIGDRERCLAADMDDFVAKPVSMVTLREVVRRWCPGASETPDRSGALAAGGPDTGAADGTTTGAPGDPERPRAGGEGGGEDAGRGAAIVAPVLDQLVEDLSDRQLVASVVRTYLRELPGRVSAVEESQRGGDSAGLGAATHVLRSTSGAVGALRLAGLCAEIEARLPVVGDAVAASAVRDEADRVRVELGGHLGRLVADSDDPLPGVASSDPRARDGHRP